MTVGGDAEAPRFPGGTTVVGAGAVSREVLASAVAAAPNIVAADGGAATAAEFGYAPAAVYGDMDSIPSPLSPGIPEGLLFQDPDQDTTDFDKCIRSVSATHIVAVGVTAPRLDHGLAALNALLRHSAKKIVLLDSADLCFLCPSSIEIAIPVLTRFSLFPLKEVYGSSEGLNWPIEGIRFAPDGRIGTSNHSTASAVRLRLDRPGMLAILPAAHLMNVVEALLESSAWA